MVTSMYLPGQRQNGSSKGRLHNGNGLPQFASESSAINEKLGRWQNPSPWVSLTFLSPPWLSNRLSRLRLLNPRRMYHLSVVRFGRTRGSIISLLCLFTFTFTLFALVKRFGSSDKKWPAPFTGDPPTLVFKREDLQRIWQWEIASGHYPSRRNIPEQLELQVAPENPALPPRKTSLPSRFRPPPGPFAVATHGTGFKRVYLDIQSQPPNVAYPPRPLPGSITDLDVVMDHCDFSEKKYVRDCLEVLRVGAGLDNGKRIRRGNLDNWKYIYVETTEKDAPDSTILADGTLGLKPAPPKPNLDADPDNGLTKKRGAEWEIPPIELPPPVPYVTHASLPTDCDPESPRIFHMFWTGPFTDKPYLALLSFLFTQNTALHSKDPLQTPGVCRPVFWLWINPGPAASVPNPSALSDMYNQLKANPWAAPFLHPRFKDVIQFKLWNTTEQLDGVPELKEEWRSMGTLFNSGGHIINVPVEKENNSTSEGNVKEKTLDDDDMLKRTGSKSSSSYDRLSVILSDMARFVLCHRFGGIYLDADTILLRDWEELWGWKGAFAYRWSRLEKYNTAVLHLNKGSALGTFLFRTALRNDLDFHPMTVSRYLKEAYLENLLLRLPDALFDSAWLNTEYYQRDRPPQPYFTDFGDFFDTPLSESAAPHALGFDGFFKGAFSYHFHNFWWKPFDPARNFPDLGVRFSATERLGQAERGDRQSAGGNSGTDKPVESDRRDLDWATVLKRTFESYIRGERPNMYGEWIEW